MIKKSKKAAAIVLSAAMLSTGVMGWGPLKMPTVDAAGTDGTFYVAVNGSDTNGDGSMERPFATFEKARDAARASDKENPVVYVREGTYFFDKPLELTAEDSGITFSNYSDEKVKLSGAMTLDELNWTDYKENTDIKVVQIDQNLGIDKLFINGDEQVLARYPDAVPGKLPLEGAATKAQIKARAKNYSDPAGGYIRAIHSNGWGGNDYIITGKNTSDALGLKYQWVGDNNRGNGMKDAVVVENVFEELDAPGEWYYDSKDGKLYLWPTQGMDLGKASVEASVNTDIITIKGRDSEQPVTDITLDGFTYFGTKRTMFTVNQEGKEYIPLMRGDWCVVRAGAIYMENTKNIQVQNSQFLEMGGNGIFMYGYNDKNIINNSEFINIGATAVQVVGNPVAAREASFWDHALYPDLQVHKTNVEFPELIGPATEDYPRDIEITNNHMENLGIFEKQSCGVNLSVSSRVKILHNTIHKSARSCVNVNDGTFGGHEIAYNDIYNAQLETTDHGPFNSWGRDRFWSVPKYNASGQSGEVIRHYEKDGKTYDLALIDAYQTNKIHDNRFQHNSDAAHTWGIDLDDGSSNYEIYNNLCLGLGIKLREGFNRKVYNNIILDGQFQIHVSYTEAKDDIHSNIVANSTPYGFASVNESRFKKAEYAVDQNWYFDYGAKINLPAWFYKNKTSNSFDKNALIDVSPEFKNPRGNDYTVQNQEGMRQTGFENFPMDQFGKPGCECKAPIYAKIDSGSGGSDILQREEWKGATVSGIDDNIMSATASTGYDGIYFETVPQDSEAHSLGFRERDIVKSVNGTALKEKKTFFEELNKLPDDGLVILDIHRTNRMQTLSYHKAVGEFSNVDCNDPAVKYSTEVSTDLYTQNGWYFDKREMGDDNSTICAYPDSKNTNTAWFEVEFTGTGIEFITRKYSDQGNVEMILTNAETGEEVDRRTVSCTASERLYQQTVYTSPKLPEGKYKLRGEKKSGKYFIVDTFHVRKSGETPMTVMTDPAQITYDNGSEASELRPNEKLNVNMTFRNQGTEQIKGRIAYLWYDLSAGMELESAVFEELTVGAGTSTVYKGSTQVPKQSENKALQILAVDENNIPFAYSTWIKKEGTVLPEVRLNKHTPDGQIGITYDKHTRLVTVTAAGVTQNAQAVIQAESSGELLYMEQRKAEGSKAGFAFRIPEDVTGTIAISAKVANELGSALQDSWEINTDDSVIDTVELELAIQAAEETVNNGYTKDSWYLFQKSLKAAREALNQKELTQEEADAYTAELNAAREALESTEQIAVTEGDADAIRRNGDWTIRNGTCDTIAVGATASFTFKGNKIEWYGVKASDHGTAEVSITNSKGEEVENSKKAVDCYSSSRKTDVLLYSFNGLDPKDEYTITIKQNGKSSSSSNNYIEIYSFRVYSSADENVDKTALQELYSTRSEYEAEENKYTEETYKALMDAFDNARGVLDSQEAGNAEIADTIKMLEDAIAGLAEAGGPDPEIPVTGVTLDETSAVLRGPGETVQLSAAVEPENAQNKSVKWKSSNTEVATVSEKGLVTAVNRGRAIVTVTTVTGGYTAICEVTVEPFVEVEGVKLNQNTALLTEEGETLQLEADVYPAKADCKEVSYTSTNENVATVNGEGLVTAVAKGQTVIMVTTRDGRHVDLCLVTVEIPEPEVKVTGIALTTDEIQMTAAGEMALLQAEIQPERATNRKVTYKSSDRTVAAVSENGVITAIRSGEAVITAITEDGGFTAKCTVKVNIPEVPVEAEAIVISQTEAELTKVGEILQLTAQVLPENATDKKVIWNSSNTEAAQVDESGMVTAVANGTTIITAATEDQRLTAECEIRVNIPVRVEGVKLNQNTAQFTRPGETLQLMAEVYPAQADCTEVSYSSTDASVAAVNENGVVTAGKNGQAVIMVTTQDGRYVDVCLVTVSIQENKKPVPARVSGLKALKSSTGSVKLSWKPVEGARGYRVYVYRSGKWTVKGETTGNSLTIQKLSSGTVYRVRAAAFNDAGEGELSGELKAATSPKKTTLKVSQLSGGRKAKLSWKKVKGDGYQVYVRAGKGSYKKWYDTQKTKIASRKLKKGTKYSFKVRAYTKTGSQKVYARFSGVKSVRP